MSIDAPQKKILIVEDEQLIAHSIERSLCKAGYSVPALAASAEEAFEHIEKTKPDLVLMDIHIQGPCDGVETARLIREKYHLPVIYLTAHADADTLERAKVTEPLGYLVKPVNHANLPSSIEMALYKHEVDRQLEENRALLATILGSIAEAVIVTDGAGRVQFLNRAAELLTGWSQSEALNRSFESVAALDADTDAPLLLQALASSRTMLIPRETTLRTKAGVSVFVDGHIAVSSTKGRAAGAMITLHDATVRRQEEQRLRQENRMLSVGQMANDIANDFYGLFDLISSFSEQLTAEEEQQDEAATAEIAHYIGRASRAGVTLSRQLVDLGSSQGSRPTLLNLNQILADRLPLYNHMCGASIVVETDLHPELDLVLNHPLHLEKLVANLVLSAKHSMPYGGRIRVATSNMSCPGEKGTAEKQFVRLLVESECNPAQSEALFSFASQPQNSELTMTVVNAIVAVSEGSISVRESTGTNSVTEVLLPAIASVASQHNETPATRSVVIAVGMEGDMGQRLSLALAERGILVLQGANNQEASLISSFVEGSVEVLIIDGSVLQASAQRSITNRILARWPKVKTLLIDDAEQRTGSHFQATVAHTREVRHLVDAVMRLLTGADEPQASLEIVSLSAALLASQEKRVTTAIQG